MPRVGPATSRSSTCSKIQVKSKTDATAEVERYIAIPEPGARLQDRPADHQPPARQGKAKLARSSTSANIHAQVLDTGALPLPILEKKIDDWIAAKNDSA